MDLGERNQEMKDELYQAIYAGDMERARTALDLIYTVSEPWLQSRMQAAKRRALPERYTDSDLAQPLTLPMEGAKPGDYMAATRLDQSFGAKENADG